MEPGISQKDSLTYHGKVGYAAFLQAYQTVLRYQTKFISEKFDVPGYEPLLKQIWQLFLEIQGTKDRIPIVEDDDSDDRGTSASSTPMPSSSPTLMRQQRSAGYVDGSDDSSNLDAANRSKEYKNVRYSMHRPLLVHSLALCYLTLLLLRVPITIHDLKVWVDREEMPYMRAVRLVPLELLDRLEPQYLEALDPQLRPTPSRIWKWTQQTAVFFTRNTNVTFPGINYRPIIFAMVKEMLLPLDIYNAVDRQLDQLDLALRPSCKPAMGRLPPECRILCLVLVIAKLYYNLDGVQRTPKSFSEPPVRCPDIRAWQRIVKIQISALQGIDLASKTEPKDIFSMNDASLDDYMDWFSKTWVSNQNIRGLYTPEGILNMFEIGSTTIDNTPEHDVKSDRLATIKWLYSLPHEKVPRTGPLPGSQYVATSPDKPTSKATIFDDLIELASLQNSIENHKLRRHVNQLEHWFAAQSSIPSSQRSAVAKRKRPVIADRPDSDSDRVMPEPVMEGPESEVPSDSDVNFELSSSEDEDNENFLL
ncbi:protein of unknown function [Taphrina deformans PYCC 5710]|uniref:RNA polymerase I-specific transcription initiation factor rrn7 n=1 Tax=Taphrina deformans (strain PYCC 5710 / ATCC 11124 / CBS 356.35 / IMI 108563 / JCM 9778 / NBRC 8474) TaxID=1097556 RepID=R4XE68_TAPDE|nr:protein of unknown function [Taphrina deformans PYCC 5710]|eukprot:CCG83962.1 protein of unknown function [Taphrina deformans PYCC 5710]